MPWKKNENNESVYIPSVYSKDDLPTWDEAIRWMLMMEDNGWNYYCRASLKDDMPYWKIPTELYLCATCCNQLNKMLHEDGLFVDEEFLTTLNNFCHYEDEYNKKIIPDDEFVVNLGFQIYTADVEPDYPIGKLIFTLNNNADQLTRKSDEYQRVDIRELTVPFGITAVLNCTDRKRYTVDKKDAGTLAGMVFKPIIQYFDGKPGWKDIESTKEPVKCPAGYDPAL